MSSFAGGDDLTIHAELDNDVSPELRDIKDDLRGVGTQAQTTGRQASQSSRGFNVLHRAGRLAAVGVKAAFVGALGAGYAAVRLLQASFGEARESQKVGATTAQIIKTTGKAANISAGQVGKLATKLSNVAGVDDELIQSGANQLLTFKAVRNEVGKNNKIFDRATTAALNLSKVPGMGDMVGSSKMLGKALQDPTKGLTALGKAGVAFTDQQKATIKSLVDSGDLLTAQKLILGEVEGQVNGVAAAQATWGDKAGVAFGNIEENIGTALLPLLDDTEKWFVQKGGPALQNYVGIFTRKGVPAIKRFVDQARPIAEEYLPKVVDFLGTVKDTVATIAPLMGKMFKGFLALPDWAKQAIVIGAGGAAVGSKLGAGGLFSKGAGAVASLATKAKPLPVWVVNSDGLPGTPKPPSIAKKLLPYGAAAGVAGLVFGSTVAGAYGLGKWLGGRPVASDPAKAAAYQDKLADPNYGHAGVQVNTNTSGINGLNQLSPVTLMNDTSPLIYKNGQAINRLTGEVLSANEATKLLNQQLTTTGKPVSANVTTPTIPKAATDVGGLLGMLDTVNRTSATAHVGADTSAANATLDTLRIRLFGMSFNIPVGVSAGGGGGGGASTPTPTPSSNGDDHRSKGEKLLTPTGRRRAVGGGINVEQMHVHAEGASSDVDVQGAVLDTLEAWERDRRERGNP